MKSIKCLVLLMVASASARPGIIDSLVETIAHPLSSSVAESSARSQSHSLGGSIGLGPFSIGGNLISASSRAYSSASALNSAGCRPESGYRRIGGSHAAASTESKARSIGAGIGFGPFNVGGINFNSARSEAHSSASAGNNDYDPVYVPEFGSVAQAHAQAEAQTVARNQSRYY